MDLSELLGAFGATAGAKLSSVAVTGEREEQLRGPFEALFTGLAELAGHDPSSLTVVGESAIAELHVRPDLAITSAGALVGFVELKAPGKGSDPRRFTDTHDREQWRKLRALPNLLYSDGLGLSLWRDGELIGEVLRFDGDFDGSGLVASEAVVGMVADFLSWEPLVPRGPRRLAELSARMCRLVRDEVREQLDRGSATLLHLHRDWQHTLVPGADPDAFADGFAQTVTFGLLLARARDIDLRGSIEAAARELGEGHSLIGTALDVFTRGLATDDGLMTSLGTIQRVLAVVDWPAVSRGDPDAWLYFYEHFLEVYDPALRRQTGSYYTPPEVVSAMVRLSDEALRGHLARPRGLADPDTTVLDPAVGTGTFLLGVLRAIADTAATLDGPGAVPAVLADALERIGGFEVQLGPFAVAQLRVMAELAELGVSATAAREVPLYVADTLDDPDQDGQRYQGMLYAPLTASMRAAREVKRDTPVTVVVGNPPYRERARGEGGWVEQGTEGSDLPTLLSDWLPPTDWGVSAHTKHLYNPYVYFWRWACWKVFDQEPEEDTGVVCFITAAGFLAGPGFQAMRDYLRRRADAIHVIDCSPEGHQPPVATRVFQGVQQPVCIVLAVRAGATGADTPAPVRVRQLPEGPRDDKFAALAALHLDDDGWQAAPTGWRAPFLPEGRSVWRSFPHLDDLLRYSGSGVMPGRTWPVAPDEDTLRRRWRALQDEPDPQRKAELFSEHARDRTLSTQLRDGLPGLPYRANAIGYDDGPCPPAIRIGYRSFDRQWLLGDKRVINQPNPTLWRVRSEHQLYLTALHRTAPTGGPAVTATALIPDLHHYRGSFGGRAYPLWLDPDATEPNVVPGLLAAWTARLGTTVAAPDLLAYVAAVAAHPGYVARFAEDLRTPGIRVPLTADADSFAAAVALGRRVLWLHTYGERHVDPAADPPRPAGPPRTDPAPLVVTPVGDTFPDQLHHDPATEQLHVGEAIIAPVSAAVRAYEVSGANVIDKWFGYRRATRTKPKMGARRDSALEELRPARWPSTYTTELLELLHVLAELVALEPQQGELLGRIVDGPLVSVQDLTTDQVLPVPDAVRKPTWRPGPQVQLEL